MLNISGWQGPLVYAWSGPNGYQSNLQNIANLPPGIYCVTITDDVGCSETKCFTLTAITSVGIQSVTNVAYCFTSNLDCENMQSTCDGAINLLQTSQAPVTYIWSNGQTTMDIANLCQGYYSVTVTYANTCTQVLSANICCCFALSNVGSPTCLSPCSIPVNQPAPALGIEFSITAPLTNISADGIIDITPIGGSSYSQLFYNWTGPNGMTSTSQDVKYVNPGLYCVTVTDGCSSTNTCIRLTACSEFSLTQASIQHNCNEFKIGAINTLVLGGNPPFTYSWSDGSTMQNLVNVLGGLYTVTVTDFGGCVKTISATINTTPPSIWHTSTPCARNARCGNITLQDIHPPQAGGYTDCNSFSLYCDWTGKVVGAGTHPIENIFDSYECILTCFGNQAVYGESISDILYDVDYNSLKCFYGNGCLFNTLKINGESYTQYFLPSGPLDVNNFGSLVREGLTCEDNPECCMYRFWCRETLVGQSYCSCPEGVDPPDPPDPADPPLNWDQQEIPIPDPPEEGQSCESLFGPGSDDVEAQLRRRGTLVKYLQAFNLKTGTKKFGIHAKADIGMSLIDYFELINEDRVFPVKTYDISELNQISENQLQIKPNPFYQEILIDIPKNWVSTSHEVNVRLLNNVGGYVHEQKYSLLNQQQITITTTDLPAGVYHVLIEHGGEVFHKVVIKA